MTAVITVLSPDILSLLNAFISLARLIPLSKLIAEGIYSYARTKGLVQFLRGPFSVKCSSYTPQFQDGSTLHLAKSTLVYQAGQLRLYFGVPPTGDVSFRAVALERNHQVYVDGNSQRSHDVDMSHIDRNVWTLHNVLCGELEADSIAFCGQLYNDVMFAFESAPGHYHMTNFGQIYLYISNEWTRVPLTGSIPSARTGYTTVNVGENLVLFGGSTSSGHSGHSNSAWRLDVSKMCWIAIAASGITPLCRRSHSAVTVGHDMWILGGYGY